MICIRVKDGPNKGKVYPVADNVVCIGRDKDVQIHIVDQGVSRRHAEIFRIGEMFFIRDLQSRNGTYVNEERISEELLCEGDRIRIGQTTLLFDAKVPTRQVELQPVEFSHVEADPGATMEFRFGVMDYADIEEPAPSGTKEPDVDVASLRSQGHLSVLYQVARATSGESEPHAMLSVIIELCCSAVGAGRGYIFVQNPPSGEHGRRGLSLKASHDEEGGALVVSSTIVKRVINSGRAVLTADASVDKRFKSTDSVVMSGLKSVICAPLVGPPSSAQKVIGVIYVASSDPGALFSVEDFELITAIGIQTGIALSNIRSAGEQRRMFSSVICALVSALEVRDPARRGRAERVAKFAEAIADVVGMPVGERHSLHITALLHDIGRLCVCEADIHPRQADQAKEESLEYKQARYVEQLLKDVEGMGEILPALVHSFEKFDGSGYPDGLAGEEIPMHARIIAAARAFDETLGGGPRDRFTTKAALLALDSRAQQGEIDPKLIRALAIAYRSGLLDQ